MLFPVDRAPETPNIAVETGLITIVCLNSTTKWPEFFASAEVKNALKIERGFLCCVTSCRDCRYD
jgi:hypothetical protein